MLQKLPVCDPFLYRNIFAGSAPIRRHQLSSGGADRTAGLFHNLCLGFQLALFPPVIRIQKCDIFSPGFLYAPVSGTGSPHILFILDITDLSAVHIFHYSKFCAVCRTVINDQHFYRNLLSQCWFDRFSNISFPVIYGHHYGNQWFFHKNNLRPLYPQNARQDDLPQPDTHFVSLLIFCLRNP